MSDSKPKTAFSELLHAARRRTGITQKQCAEILGVSRRTINLWDNGEMIPHLLMQEGALYRLAKLPTKRTAVDKYAPKMPTPSWDAAIAQLPKDTQPLGGPGPASERVITPETLEEPLRPSKGIDWAAVDWTRPPFEIAQELGIPLSTVLKNKPNRS